MVDADYVWEMSLTLLISSGGEPLGLCTSKMGIRGGKFQTLKEAQAYLDDEKVQAWARGFFDDSAEIFGEGVSPEYEIVGISVGLNYAEPEDMEDASC